ncbi:MAG: Maf family protein [Gammaproteobacteria bacterium]
MSQLKPESSPTVVLASGSAYRRQLLARLGIPFLVVSPELDERRIEPETASELTRRLAEAKSNAVRDRHPNALIIGSDQVAVLDGEILRKPGSLEANIKQLMDSSGHPVQILTSLCLLNARTGRIQMDTVSATVHFRLLSRPQVEHYVRRERPFDCAGGFKSEGLGIALFSRVEAYDPTALVGLPLISLIKMLDNERLDVLKTA